MLRNSGRPTTRHALANAQSYSTNGFRSSPLNWLFGLGAAASWGIQGIYPHVVPVEVLAELGLFGLVGYCCLVAMVVHTFVKLGKLTSKNPVDRGTVAVMATLYFFHWIMSLKQGSFIFFYHSFFIAILAAPRLSGTIDDNSKPLIDIDIAMLYYRIWLSRQRHADFRTQVPQRLA